jgi:hypothetical protein
VVTYLFKYYYLVSFVVQHNSDINYGFSCVLCANKIKSYKDIEMIKKSLEDKYKADKVIILNYELLQRELHIAFINKIRSYIDDFRYQFFTKKKSGSGDLK